MFGMGTGVTLATQPCVGKTTGLPKSHWPTVAWLTPNLSPIAFNVSPASPASL